jgi:hypothetical protein
MSFLSSWDRLMQWFVARLCAYLFIGLVITLISVMWDGDGWVSEMGQESFPWVVISVFTEMYYRLTHRKRAETPKP